MDFNEQVKTLVSRYKIGEKLEKAIDRWIEQLSCMLATLEELPAQNLDKRLLDKVHFPLVDNAFRQDASVLFQPPTVHAIGSYPLGCTTRNDDKLFEIDLVLEFPKSCWLKKDNVNFVYHRKRAFYLAILAKNLLAFTDLIAAVHFKFANLDPLKPILEVTPAGKLASLCRFNLFAQPSLDKSFVFSKFHYKKCNITDQSLIGNCKLESSPLYNSSILSDLTLVYLTNKLQSYIANYRNIQDALVLLRIWLDRRGLRSIFANIVTVFTCHLLRNNLLNPNLSCLQIFKEILSQIALSSWHTEAVVFNFDENSENEISECQDVLTYFPLALHDASCNLNVCSNITLDQYERLRYDSQSSGAMLSDAKLDIVRYFNTNIESHCYFDYLVNISTESLKPSNLHNKARLIATGFNLTKAILPELVDVIQIAVGDRLTLLQHFQLGIADRWSVCSPPPNSQPRFITLGLLLKLGKATEVLTKGPQANQPEAGYFRELWGDKSEIRRFQNGDICEAVYWKCNSAQERRSIVINAIKYIVNRKNHIKINAITSTFGYLDSLLELKPLEFEGSEFEYGTGEECLAMINQSMVKLKQHLHNLSQLPFNVIDVVGIDPVLRSTEVFPPYPINSSSLAVKHYCCIFDVSTNNIKAAIAKPIKIIVKIDPHIKLSDDYEAFKNQKYLYLYELGKSLAKSHNLLVRVSQEGLDVYLNGFVFRVVLSIGKELFICQQVSNRVKSGQSELADSLEFECHVLPALSSCLNTLGKENDSFALTCRLFKRWLSRQMVKHFFHDVTLDLLVAYSHLHYSNLYPNSDSPVSGFIRLLDFFANFDFVKNPLILNFNNALSAERIHVIRENFESDRTNLPMIYIVTPYDRKLSYHTMSTNNLVVAHTRKLTKALLEKLSFSLHQFKLADFKDMCKPNMALYDIIIKLNTKSIVDKYQSLDFPVGLTIRQPIYDEELRNFMPITGYNPTKIYVSALKKAFSNLALFFYDQHGGKEIGVLLKPEALQPRPFKYSSVEASLLTSTAHSLTTDNVALNLNALIEDCHILGEGLVEKVTVNSDKFNKVAS